MICANELYYVQSLKNCSKDSTRAVKDAQPPLRRIKGGRAQLIGGGQRSRWGGVSGDDMRW